MPLQIPNFEAERTRSEEFFTRRDSYNRFYVVGSLPVMACVDTRDVESDNPIRTAIQTAGARAGEGIDQGIAHYADTGEFINPFEGAVIAKRSHPWAVGDAHFTCALVENAETALGEMAEPSDQTEERVDYLVDFYGYEDILTSSVRQDVKDGAKRQQEWVRERNGISDIVPFIGELEPHHNNVARMKGDSNPAFWLGNHSAYLGLNREKKHREAGLVVKAYHSSVAASLRESMNSKIPAIQRRYRMAANLYRDSAARSIFGNSYNLKYIDIVPDDRVAGGLRFDELDG